MNDGVGIKFLLADNTASASVAGGSLVGAAIAAKRAVSGDEDSSTDLAFLISQNDETLDEAMRIDSAGNVGIGTTNPSSLASASSGINSNNAFSYVKAVGYGVFSSNSSGPGLYINKTNASTSESTDYINFRNKGVIVGSMSTTVRM